jgi:hypothetical protein
LENPLTKFVDYNELADPLELPINGVVYRIPGVSMADGIKFTALLKNDPTKAKIDDDAWLKAMLGTAYDLMLKNNVPFTAVYRAAAAAMADFSSNRELAEVMWATGGDPKEVASYLKKLNPPNRATRRTPSTSTGGDAKTPTRASTKATTSRKV